jgi:hypothetical protein
MPHVRRSVLVTIDAPPEAVRDALVSEAALSPSAHADDGVLTGPFTAVPFEGTTLEARLRPSGHDTAELSLEACGTYVVPFFGWFVALQANLAARSELRYLVDRVRAKVHGAEPPEHPRRWPIVPPVPFTADRPAASLPSRWWRSSPTSAAGS